MKGGQTKILDNVQTLWINEYCSFFFFFVKILVKIVLGISISPNYIYELFYLRIVKIAIAVLIYTVI